MPLLIQRTVQNDLTLGDITGQVGNRVGNIIVGHGQDGDLGNRTLGGYR